MRQSWALSRVPSVKPISSFLPSGVAPMMTRMHCLPIYAQAQEMLVEDSPAVFTRWRVSNYEVRPWVTGLSPTAQDSENFGDLFYEDVKILEH